MLTVQDVLQLKTFENARVIAGANGLGRMVNSITVGEVPDQEFWLHGGEIILTALYIFRENPMGVTEMVEQYIQKNAAAIVFKPGRFLDSIDPESIAVAERKSFPIIEIPERVRWPEIIYEVVEELAQKGTRLQRDLHRSLMEEHNMGKGLKMLAEQVNSEVILSNKYMGFLASSYEFLTETVKDEEDSFSKWWRGRQGANEVFHGIMEVKPPSRAGGKRFVCPVICGKEHLGYLSLRNNQDHLSPAYEEGLLQAAILVGTEMLRQRAGAVAELRSRTNLFEYLITGGDRWRLMRSDHLEHPMGVALVLRPVGGKTIDETLLRDLELDLLNLASNELKDLRHHLLIGFRDGDLIVFLPQDFSCQEGINPKMLADKFRQIAEEILQVPVVVGMGSLCHSLADLNQSIQKAHNVIEFCSGVNGLPKVISGNEVGLHALLKQIDPNLLIEFSEEVLRPLLEYDRRHQSELLKTLKVYFLCDKSITRTAEMLYLHRNSVTHRLAQISDIAGLDFAEVEACLTWQVAAKVHTILQERHK